MAQSAAATGPIANATNHPLTRVRVILPTPQQVEVADAEESRQFKSTGFNPITAISSW
jgi:hypothetical protein